MDLCRKRFYSVSFADQDLSGLKMTNSLYFRCDFDRANMSETDCTGSEFTGSSFRQTNCYRTNFTNAKLGNTIFEPKDLMGATFTMTCQTFDGARVSALWIFGMFMFIAMMKPTGTTEPIIENLKAMIGAERYIKLRGLFQKRDI